MMKKQNGRSGVREGILATACLGAIFSPGLSGQGQELPEGEIIELEEFVVTGAEFDAMRAAIANQREAGNIKTVVDAGAFGDVTEGNVGEFLKYLPGVSVDFVSADVRSVSVRGLASSFTPVTMDGNRMASAASSQSTRTFEFEQVSLNNVARIEVVKVPTPSMEADSLGGAVNMVSRNAFELRERKLDYRFYFSVPGDHIRWGRTPGPGEKATRKVRPGFDLTYSDPITENFGIVLNYTNSETFTPQQYFITQWDTIGRGPEAPYLRYFNLRDGPKISQRESISLKADWRVLPNSILSLGVQRNEYSTSFFNREVRWEMSSTGPGYYGPEFTRLDPSNSPNGRFRHQLNTREKVGETTHIDLGMKHFLENWEISYDGYHSKSENEYRDTENGHFERITFRTPGTLDVAYEGIGEEGPATVVTKLDGVEFDPFKLTSLTALDTSSAGLRSGPWYASDTIYGGKFDIRRSLTLGGLPASLQAGMLYRSQEREIDRQQYSYSVTSAYNAQPPDPASFLDTHYAGQELGWGWPAPEWPDPFMLYRYFLDNPGQFVLNEVASVIYNEENRQRVEEAVTAAYVMGTLSLMDNRLKVIGGVRFERTDTEGEGYEVDSNVIYQRNPDGSFVLKIPVLGDTLQNRVVLPEFEGSDRDPAVLAKRVRAQYANRRITKNHYDDFYPSLHFTYQATKRLQVRLAYARTLGRPNINDLAPGIRYSSSSSLDEDVGQEIFKVEVSNPTLKAYTGDNFDLSLEYYFDTGGVLSFGVFHKKISGFIDREVSPLTNELAALYGVDPVYVSLGYWVERTVNAGDVDIKGYEVSLIQDLHFLPDWATGLSVFANATVLSTRGDYGEMQSQLIGTYVPGFVKQTLNWGVTLDRGPWDIRLKWNHRGKQMRDTGDVRGQFADRITDWNRFYDKRLTTDLNIEYRFSRYARLFLNGRNIFNEPTDQLRAGALTPDYAQLERREKFGALWTVGIKGTY
jgi:iron complex outermembrane recepter protein